MWIITIHARDSGLAATSRTLNIGASAHVTFKLIGISLSVKLRDYPLFNVIITWASQETLEAAWVVLLWLIDIWTQTREKTFIFKVCEHGCIRNLLANRILLSHKTVSLILLVCVIGEARSSDILTIVAHRYTIICIPDIILSLIVVEDWGWLRLDSLLKLLSIVNQNVDSPFLDVT